MQNPHDLAHNLARVLRESPENQAFQAARRKIKGDAKAEGLVRDFQRKQLELQAQQLSGKPPTQEQAKSLEQLYGVLSLNPDIKEYLQAEYRLGQLMGDIQKILADAVEVEFPG